MDERTADSFLKIYKDGLLHDTLPFWTSHSVDVEQGGFFTYIDRDGTVIGTDKPMWLQCRIAWLFFRLYNELEPRTEWLELAQHALAFVEKFGFDEDGRMFFTVTRNGEPLRKRRYLYTECFGALAFAECARATGSEQARNKAICLYKTILKHHNTLGLLEPKFFTETRPMKSHGMIMMLVYISQALRRIDEDPVYTSVIDDCIRQLQSHFIKPGQWPPL
jgi:N-acylglucosamine 2-epimerase